MVVSIQIFLFTECNLVFPASVINGNAVSKTFTVLYRNEDISVDDVILYKVYILVDPNRVSRSMRLDLTCT